MTIPIYIGSDPVVKVYVGASEAEAIYVGEDKVWPLSGSYVAKAVHFEGESIVNPSLLSSNSDSLTFALWFKYAGTVGPGTSAAFFFLDPLVLDNPSAQIGSSVIDFRSVTELGAISSDSTKFQYVESSADGTPQDGDWHLVLACITTNSAGIPRPSKMYFDNTDVTSQTAFDGSGFYIPGAFSIPILGKQINCFNDVYAGSPFIGDIADFWFAPGISLLDGGGDIPLATRRLFIDADGKPVDPAIAIAALGVPSILLSGDSTTFPVNQGTDAAVTLRKNISSTGINGAGAVTAIGAVVGQPVYQVISWDNGTDISSDFESTISVGNEIQQTSTDHTGENLRVWLPGSITNASSSPSD